MTSQAQALVNLLAAVHHSSHSSSTSASPPVPPPLPPEGPSPANPSSPSTAPTEDLLRALSSLVNGATSRPAPHDRSTTTTTRLHAASPLARALDPNPNPSPSLDLPRSSNARGTTRQENASSPFAPTPDSTTTTTTTTTVRPRTRGRDGTRRGHVASSSIGTIHGVGPDDDGAGGADVEEGDDEADGDGDDDEEEGPDPATLLFNDYFDFPSSDEEDLDFDPSLIPPVEDAADGDGDPDGDGDADGDDDADWWNEVFGTSGTTPSGGGAEGDGAGGARRRDRGEVEDDAMTANRFDGSRDRPSDNARRPVSISTEEFAKELALLTGDVATYADRRVAGNSTASTPRTPASTVTPGSSDYSRRPQAQRVERANREPGALERDELDLVASFRGRARGGLEPATASTAVRSRRRSAAPDAVVPETDQTMSATVATHSTRRAGTRPVSANEPSLPSTASGARPLVERIFVNPPVTTTTPTTAVPDVVKGSTLKKRPRAIYTEEEAKERRRAQERERQKRRRAEDKVARQEHDETRRQVVEWRERAEVAERRVKELEDEVERLRTRWTRAGATKGHRLGEGRGLLETVEEDDEDDESDGGEFVMHEGDEGDSTQESSSSDGEGDDPDVDDDEVSFGVGFARSGPTAGHVDASKSSSSSSLNGPGGGGGGGEGGGLAAAGLPQMDLNLSNLGSDSLNQLLSIVHQAAKAQGIQLDANSGRGRAE
ncbi:hypothetical protein JCM10212_005419 [Sporobolomyces blumeae]